MKLGLLSRAKIGAYCSMKFINFENELYAVLNKKSAHEAELHERFGSKQITELA
jgi:hypothetical protein